eukprot:4391594-Prymnesium_polylepis.1
MWPARPHKERRRQKTAARGCSRLASTRRRYTQRPHAEARRGATHMAIFDSRLGRTLVTHERVIIAIVSVKKANASEHTCRIKETGGSCQPAATRQDVTGRAASGALGGL